MTGIDRANLLAHDLLTTGAITKDEAREMVAPLVLPPEATYEAIWEAGSERPVGYVRVPAEATDHYVQNMRDLLWEQRLGYAVRQPAELVAVAVEVGTAPLREAAADVARARCELCALTHPLTFPAWEACLEHAVKLWSLRARGVLRERTSSQALPHAMTVVGMLGVLHELLIASVARPVLLLLFAAVMGLPLWLAAT